MSSAPLLMEPIGRAEYHVRNARQSWNASSASGGGECGEHLTLAIAEIRRAHSAAADGITAPQAKERLDRLQQDIALLGRLIDSSISFYRGLALHTGMDELVCSPAER